MSIKSNWRTILISSIISSFIGYKLGSYFNSNNNNKREESTNNDKLTINNFNKIKKVNKKSTTNKSSNTDILIIGVAGGSGSGKSTLVNNIYNQYSNETSVITICLDNYYKPLDHLSLSERNKINFDHPNALDLDLLLKHIQMLKNGENIEIPIYDFTVHNRKKETISIKIVQDTSMVIILEGILTFTNKDIANECDIKVFIDTAADIRAIRRIKRDILERGRSIESVCQQYIDTVRPMHNKFVEIYKHQADIVIPNGSNQISEQLLMYQINQHLGL